MTDHGGEQSGIPQPGEVIGGKYEVQTILGAGGMGVVLAAQHIELGQRVALKFLNAQFARNAEMVARFLREARAAAAVQSEHVARVLDVTRTEDGTPYIVMEHLVGMDLDQLIRARGPLPIDEAIDYVLQACEAIAEAHAAGIVHRDLKPGNLFLTRRADGSSLVKVLDFGMSKIVATQGSGEEGNLTSPVAMLGSPFYMSPEQVKSSKNVDHRTDVWALGVVLHKLITGAQAFKGPTLSSCLVKIVTEPPELLRARRPDAPAELEAVILHCLEKDIDRRLQNVAELSWALYPFAPERSRLSIERIVRVLLGSDVLTEKTLPLSAVAADPLTIKLVRSAETPPVPVPAQPETSTAAVATASILAPKRAPRWPVVAGVACALLVGAALLGARLFRVSPIDPAAAVEAPASAVSIEPPAPSAPSPEVLAPNEPSPTVTSELSPAATAAPKKSTVARGDPPALIRKNPFGEQVPTPTNNPKPQVPKPAQTNPPEHPGML